MIFQHFACISIKNADSTDPAATKAAEPLVVGFSCKVEAQFGDFSIAAFKELVYAPGDKVFVYLKLNTLRNCDNV